MKNLNIAALVFAGVLGVGYIVRYLYNATSPNKDDVFISQNLRIIRLWISRHSNQQDSQTLTLAVQTMRNTLMIAIFIGGAAFSYAVSNLGNVQGERLENRISSLIVSILLILGFLCWMQVIRAALLLGYTLGVWNKDSVIIGHDVQDDVWTEAQRELNKKKRYESCLHLGHTMLICVGYGGVLLFCSIIILCLNDISSVLNRLGFRFLYAIIPFAFFEVGPVALIVASVIILIIQVRMDSIGTQWTVRGLVEKLHSSPPPQSTDFQPVTTTPSDITLIEDAGVFS